MYLAKTARSWQNVKSVKRIMPIYIYFHSTLYTTKTAPSRQKAPSAQFFAYICISILPSPFTRQIPRQTGKKLCRLQQVCHMQAWSYVLRQRPLLNGKKLRLPQFLLPIFVFPYYHSRKSMPYVLPEIPLLAGKKLWRQKIFHICTSINWSPWHFIFTCCYILCWTMYAKM